MPGRAAEVLAVQVGHFQERRAQDVRGYERGELAFGADPVVDLVRREERLVVGRAVQGDVDEGRVVHEREVGGLWGQRLGQVVAACLVFGQHDVGRVGHLDDRAADQVVVALGVGVAHAHGDEDLPLGRAALQLDLFVVADDEQAGVAEFGLRRGGRVLDAHALVEGSAAGGGEADQQKRKETTESHVLSSYGLRMV